MHPKLFEIPFANLTVWSYGLMMVFAFLAAVTVIRRLSRNITPDPQLITNASLYSLIAGVVGARLFYVIHYFDKFGDNLLSVFAIWEGGLELLGGVILAVTVILLYLMYHKLPVRQYLDILAVGLLLALAFGRIGCFLNGCCFGKPTDLPWAVRFPYGSPAYNSQVNANPTRNRPDPQVNLPGEFFALFNENGVARRVLKQYDGLTEAQKQYLKANDRHRSLSVHPTQLYSAANGLFGSVLLFLFWRRYRGVPEPKKLLAKPGCSFALMFVYYGIARFCVEFLRDDNPFEYAWWVLYKGRTVSQNLGIYMIIFGIALMALFTTMKQQTNTRPRAN